ncbi:MAG TPA: acyl-CoA dehydrogenase family protein [Polyangiaceae bacterium]|nr:acyl-CoA dehydrogenase family protein [Polyangiaceae bacterium]
MSASTTDYFQLGRHFSAEERALQSSVRSFVDARILPDIAARWEQGSFPEHTIREIGALGVLGCTLQGYGCAGSSHVAYGLAMQELERGDSGIRSFASVQGSLVMYAIHTFGSEEQRNGYLPSMAAGETVGCFGLTEPDFGSNPAAMRTVAIDDGNEYVIRGVKRWITNGHIAHVALVWAKLGGPTGEVHGFLVPTDSRGFEAWPIDHKASLRASATSELVLDDVRVPKSAILPGVRGMKGPLACLSEARLGVAWGAIGAAAACFECALDYAKSRVQFAGKPIAAHQLVQAKLADMLTRLTAMQLMAFEASRLARDKKLRPQHVSMVKRHNASAALDIARCCRGILGGNGISLEYPVVRHMCNLETVITYEGTDDIHALVLGQDVTGISAFE